MKRRQPPLTVDIVNLTRRIAVLSDGSTRPIVQLLDAEGEETDDEEEAVAFVCGGPDAKGNNLWWAATLADYTTVETLH